jgi:hypothetical protein
MKFFKEVISLLVILTLIGTFALLSPFLVLPKARGAIAPDFSSQDFSLQLIPIQVVQTWILEQQSVSKDIEVQETLKNFSKKIQFKENTGLEGFIYNPFGAVGMYVLANGQQRYTCYFLAGSNQQSGWLSDQYYAHSNGLFFFNKALTPALKQHFEANLKSAKWTTKKFEARKLKFELSKAPYLLEWQKHGFELHVPKESIQDKNTMLKPSGFHLSCPLALHDLLGEQTPLNGLTAISMNYYGAKLNEKQGLELAFETLLSFQSGAKLDEFLSAVQKLDNDWEWHPNYVRINDANYAFKKYGDNLFVCSSPQKYLKGGNFATQLKTQSLYCAGDPKLLTKLDNAGWAAAVLELFPIYRALNDLSDRTKSVSTHNQTISWQLHSKYYAAGEFLKLFGTAFE